MKKLLISLALALSSTVAFPGGLLSQQSTQSVSDGQTVQSRNLDGNKLTISVCEISMTADGTRSQCVSETQKLTPKEVAFMRESIRFEQRALLSGRSDSLSRELSSMKSQSSSSATSEAISKANMQAMSGSVGVGRSLKDSAR